MFLLDTNIVNAIRYGEVNALRRYKLQASECFVSSVTVEEILHTGYMAEITSIRSNRSKSDLTRVCQSMVDAVSDLAGFKILPFTTKAEQTYNASNLLKRKKMDGRIAAHALGLGYIVVTENERDFEDIPGLTAERWLE